MKLGAGCFVLVSNVAKRFLGRHWSAAQLLAQYKEQYGIEKNFGFLKDPVIVNSIFLKKNERIEVLGMVLLISLMIWRLMERTMRPATSKSITARLRAGTTARPHGLPRS